MATDDDLFHLLTHNAPDAIYVCVDGRFRHLNPAALRLFGAESVQAMLGRSLLDHTHPDHREAVIRRIRQTRETGLTLPPQERRYLRLCRLTSGASRVA